jgi:hypothetical protein
LDIANQALGRQTEYFTHIIELQAVLNAINNPAQKRHPHVYGSGVNKIDFNLDVYYSDDTFDSSSQTEDFEANLSRQMNWGLNNRINLRMQEDLMRKYF